MDGGSAQWAWVTVAVTASISLITAILTAFLTSRWSLRREQQADWRRLKLGRYQEFVEAASRHIEGRSSDATSIPFHDAANSLLLVAPKPVLEALWAFLDENSAKNPHRSDEGTGETFDALVRAMWRDVRPPAGEEPSRQFGFIRPPPGVGAGEGQQP